MLRMDACLYRVIMDWTNENERYKDPGVGMGMTAARMQDVTFDDLDIVIGAQYLLCHQVSFDTANLPLWCEFITAH